MEKSFRRESSHPLVVQNEELKTRTSPDFFFNTMNKTSQAADVLSAAFCHISLCHNSTSTNMKLELTLEPCCIKDILKNFRLHT